MTVRVVRITGEPFEDDARAFGGEVTAVTPDPADSSRWDSAAQDEDALLRTEPVDGADDGAGSEALPPVEDARPNGDVAGLSSTTGDVPR